MLRNVLYGISLSCFILQALADEDRTPPNFSLYMEEFCSSRPYDCMDSKIITAHLLNTFHYEFYLEVEDFFSYQGFDRAEFEYCVSSRCLEEGMSVKNSKYKITQIFPHKRDYVRAFGGVNRNSGVYFSRVLTEEQADDWCSVRVRPGNKLSSKARRAIEKGEESLWNLKTKYYKKYSLSYVQYLPQINALDRNDNATANECWLRYKKKRMVFEKREASR
tara:strand:- start:203 stop:862 length:660 start_codon:yes stop_codon:yes gene_type:complete